MAVGPAVRAVARVVDAVALDHDALDARRGSAERADARVLVHADLPAGAVGAGEAPPAADVVVLDHDVMHVGLDTDRVLLRALEREAANDHVRRADADVELLSV